MRLSIYIPTALLVLAAGSDPMSAKDKKKPASPPQDEITVEAHLANTGGPIVRFVATRHYSRSYVYAERGPDRPVTLLDITKPSQPVVVSQMDALSGTTGLVVVAGTAAISTTAPIPAAASTQTIRLMDFSNPAQPKVTRQFDGVTTVEKVGNLILLANPEGIWVLSQHLAEDPAVEAAYAHQVVYQ